VSVTADSPVLSLYPREKHEWQGMDDETVFIYARRPPARPVATVPTASDKSTLPMPSATHTACYK